MAGMGMVSLFLAAILVHGVASSEKYCEGDECSLPSDCTTFQVLTFILSGLACTAVVFDVYNRYFLQEKKEETKEDEKKEEKKEEPVTSSVTSQAFTAAAPPPITPEDEALIMQEVARTQAAPPLPPKTEEPEVKRAETPEMTPVTPQKTEDPDSLKDLIANMLEVMRLQVGLSTIEELEPSCVEKLDKIGDLEQACTSLSGEFDACAVNMVQQDQEGQESEEPEADRVEIEGTVLDNNHAAQTKRLAMRSRWIEIRRLFYCVDVHLRNASHYQQFFYGCGELQKVLEQYVSETRDKLTEDVPVIEDADDLDNMIAETKDILKQLRMWDAQVTQLAESSRTVVPVRMRTEPVTEPQPIKMLCSYKKDELEVEEGEDVMLMENADTKEWTVEKSDGEQAAIPSITCLIPPPDKDAMYTAARLRRSMQDVYNSTNALLKKRFVSCSLGVFRDFTENKSELFGVIEPPTKSDLRDDLEQCNDVINQHFTDHDDYPTLVDLASKIKDMIDEADEYGDEDEAVVSQILDMLEKLAELLALYQDMTRKGESFKSLHYNVSQDEIFNDTEWDTLDDVDQARGSETTIGVNVAREHATQGESTSLMSGTGEVRQTFSIKSVVDPKTGEEISMDDAIASGVINQTRGVYVTEDGTQIPIQTAMAKGFILVESTQTKKTRELVQAVGVVKVTFTRETRPYTVKRVLDPRTDEVVSVDEAIEREIFDPSKGVWKNPDSKEEMGIENAIDCGGLIVEYDPEAEVGEPDVTTKVFAVYGVMDRKENKRLPFHEAAERGLIDKEQGLFVDNLTGESLSVVDALKTGYVKARVVEEGENVDDLKQLTNKLSGSQDSLQSEGSSGHRTLSESTA